ncbi:hypothetical protein ACFX2I_043663 [Malus domestica]
MLPVTSHMIWIWIFLELLNFIAGAWEKKCSYDGQPKGLMGQYKVKRDEEIVIEHVWSIPKSNSKKQGELELLKQS